MALNGPLGQEQSRRDLPVGECLADEIGNLALPCGEWVGRSLLVLGDRQHRLSRLRRALVGLAGVGLTWSYLVGIVLAVMQTARPELSGRVMALFAAVLLSGRTVSGPLTTAVTAIAGPRAPFLLGAGAAALVGLLLFSLRGQSAAAGDAP